MTVQEFIPRLNNKTRDVTFIVTKAVKDKYTPYYHAEYMTTPLFEVNEVKNGLTYKDYIILNDNVSPIEWLSGATWTGLINMGVAKCMLIIKEDDLKLLTPDANQRAHMIKFIDSIIVGERK